MLIVFNREEERKFQREWAAPEISCNLLRELSDGKKAVKNALQSKKAEKMLCNSSQQTMHDAYLLRATDIHRIKSYALTT